MQITCSCGKILNVPQTLVGKAARCPACKKILQMPGAVPAAPAARPASRIAVVCSCGKKLAAPVAAAGKKVRCPKCNKELTVPAPAKPRGAPVITSMPPPASYAAAPAEPRKPVPFPAEDLTFDVEPPPPEPPQPKPLPEDSPGGEEEKSEYGLGTPKCPNCKANLAQGSQFCIECGTAFATGAKMKSAAALGTTKKGVQVDGETVKKILVGVVVVAGIAFGGWQVYKFLCAPHAARQAASQPAAQPEARKAPTAAPTATPPLR
jgi:hypothetical protein